MALSFSIDTDQILELDEYVDYVKHNVDLLDLDSIAASAPQFRALMNNRRVITDVINQQLTDWSTFQAGNTYTAQTFMLAFSPGFYLRANIWAPLSDIPEIRAAESQNYYYMIPHDHNFSFMTGGYLGSGYRTAIWEYDHETIAGVRGEKVDLRFLEHTSLPEGKIMVYRKSIDVHHQEHADEFSISLNLMVIPDETVTNRSNQFIFDSDAGSLKSVLSSSAGRIAFCELAQHVGDSKTAGLLDELSTLHPDSRLRGACIRSLTKMFPGDSESIFERASRDKHPYVKQLGVRGLQGSHLAEAEYLKQAVDHHAAFDSGAGGRDAAPHDNMVVD